MKLLEYTSDKCVTSLKVILIVWNSSINIFNDTDYLSHIF